MLNHPDDPKEVEGAYFWAATADEARKMFAKTIADANESDRPKSASRVVWQLVVGGKVVDEREVSASQ